MTLLKDIDKVLASLQVKDGMHHVSWKVLGGRDFISTVDCVLNQLNKIMQILIETMEAETKVYRALAPQFAMSFFMPFCVVTNSLVGRLFVLAQSLLVRCVEAHHCISLAYLAQVALANPLRASTIAKQLSGYRMSNHVVNFLTTQGEKIDSDDDNACIGNVASTCNS